MSTKTAWNKVWQCFAILFFLFYNKPAAEHLQLALYAMLWGERKFRLRFPAKGKIISPYSPAIVQDFESLAENLVPSDQYMQEGRAMAKIIFETLSKNAHKYGVKIGRTRIAGSSAKGTGIVTLRNGTEKRPDLDLVVIINDREPPFRPVYRKFEKIFKKELHGVVKNVRSRKRSMKFTICSPTQNEISVDLLASPNFIEKKKGVKESEVKEDMATAQANRASKLVSDNQIKAVEENEKIDLEWNRRYSSSFTAKTVAVIRSLVSDPYVLKVVRLAKKWNSEVKATLPYEFFPARSCMIELVAIYMQKEKGRKTKGRNGQRCVVCGFKRFLEAMSNLRNLRLSLDDSDLVHLEELEAPIVCDPVNGYNNYAEGLEPEVVDVLVYQAEKTLEKLEEYRHMKGVEYKKIENPIEGIFGYKIKKNENNESGQF